MYFSLGQNYCSIQNVPGYKSMVFSSCARGVPCTCHPRAVQRATQRSGKTCWRVLLVEHTFQDGRLEASPVLGVAQRMCDEGVVHWAETICKFIFLHIKLMSTSKAFQLRRTFSPRGKSGAQFLHFLRWTILSSFRRGAEFLQAGGAEGSCITQRCQSIEVFLVDSRG